MRKKLAIVFGATIAATAVGLTWHLLTGPLTDEGRYRELCRVGSLYKGAWTGKLRFVERAAAAIHFTGLTNYYRIRVEEDSKALLRSGYFVETSVPVPELKAKIPQVLTTLSKTFGATGAYYEAKLNWPSNEVHLVCRKEDIPVWKQALEKVFD